MSIDSAAGRLHVSGRGQTGAGGWFGSTDLAGNWATDTPYNAPDGSAVSHAFDASNVFLSGNDRIASVTDLDGWLRKVAK